MSIPIDNFSHMPSDILLARIFPKLKHLELLALMQTNTIFHALVAESEDLWVARYRQYFPTRALAKDESGKGAFFSALKELYAKDSSDRWHTSLNEITLSKTLLADDTLFKSLLTHRGRLLQHASEEHQSDRKVVLTAVRQHGRSLMYASSELQADKEVVLAAVSQDGRALQSASSSVKKRSFFRALDRSSIKERERMCLDELKWRQQVKTVEYSSTSECSGSGARFFRQTHAQSMQNSHSQYVWR